MRGSRTITLSFVAALAAAPAAAQQSAAAPSPLVRADIHGTLGWLNVESSVPTRHDDWYRGIFFGGGGFGWYWTDHLKTEIDVGASNAAELYSSEPVVIAGQTTYLTFQQKFHTRTIAVGQHYQFYRNAWFHPYLAAGVEAAWETIERRDEPLFFYDQVTRQSRIAREARTGTRVQSVEARPFAATGFKAYMSQRSFFRSDLRLTMRSGIDEVLLRFGFGVDF